ncbi:hypothetical protein ACRAWD_28825 [Caulobacter segnis]
MTTAVGQRRPVQEDHRRRAAARSSQLKNTINTMVGPAVRPSPSEVTRVAREVGTRRASWAARRRSGRRRHLEGPDRQRST